MPSDIVCSGSPLACPIVGSACDITRPIANAVVVPVNNDLSPGSVLCADSLCTIPVASTSDAECCHAAPRTAVPIPSVPRPWTSLFSSKPRNAGIYEPVDFDIVEENGVMIPPPCVMQAGIEFWSEYVVGFFLDPIHRLRDVAAVCRRAWRLHGGLRVKLVDSLYYLLFSSPEERRRVLESEPSFFDGQPFILTPWSPTIASVREQVFSVPVWVYFSQIPSALQPLLGLN